MTGKEAAELIGRKGQLAASGLDVNVEVLDARSVFGRVDLLVRPLAGAGQAWVGRERVNLTN